jgi:CheY-like chemotaxis protein
MKPSPLEDDAPLFADEVEEDPTAGLNPPWRVLVVDDDEDVLAMTRLSLSGLVVDGCPVQIIEASSAREARLAFAHQGPFAAAIVDVIMETVTAGFVLLRWIRQEQRDQAVRVVLRTGQPGDAQEARVMDQYDVHDYLGKAETSSRALNTSVIGAVRAWRDIQAVAAESRALRRTLAGLEALLRAPRGAVALAALSTAVADLLAPRQVSLLILGPRDWDHGARAPATALVATGRYDGLQGLAAEDLLLEDDSALQMGPLRLQVHAEEGPLNERDRQHLALFLQAAALATAPRA